MLNSIPTRKFEKDLLKAKKQKKNINNLKEIMRQLAEEEQLSPKNLDHPLRGILE